MASGSSSRTARGGEQEEEEDFAHGARVVGACLRRRRRVGGMLAGFALLLLHGALAKPDETNYEASGSLTSSLDQGTLSTSSLQPSGLLMIDEDPNSAIHSDLASRQRDTREKSLSAGTAPNPEINLHSGPTLESPVKITNQTDYSPAEGSVRRAEPSFMIPSSTLVHVRNQSSASGLVFDTYKISNFIQSQPHTVPPVDIMSSSLATPPSSSPTLPSSSSSSSTVSPVLSFSLILSLSSLSPSDLASPWSPMKKTKPAHNHPYISSSVPISTTPGIGSDTLPPNKSPKNISNTPYLQFTKAVTQSTLRSPMSKAPSDLEPNPPLSPVAKHSRQPSQEPTTLSHNPTRFFVRRTTRTIYNHGELHSYFPSVSPVPQGTSSESQMQLHDSKHSKFTKVYESATQSAAELQNKLIHTEAESNTALSLNEQKTEPSNSSITTDSRVSPTGLSEMYKKPNSPGYEPFLRPTMQISAGYLNWEEPYDSSEINESLVLNRTYLTTKVPWKAENKSPGATSINSFVETDMTSARHIISVSVPFSKTHLSGLTDKPTPVTSPQESSTNRTLQTYRPEQTAKNFEDVPPTSIPSTPLVVHRIDTVSSETTKRPVTLSKPLISAIFSRSTAIPMPNSLLSTKTSIVLDRKSLTSQNAIISNFITPSGPERRIQETFTPIRLTESEKPLSNNVTYQDEIFRAVALASVQAPVETKSSFMSRFLGSSKRPSDIFMSPTPSFLFHTIIQTIKADVEKLSLDIRMPTTPGIFTNNAFPILARTKVSKDTFAEDTTSIVSSKPTSAPGTNARVLHLTHVRPNGSSAGKERSEASNLNPAVTAGFNVIKRPLQQVPTNKNVQTFPSASNTTLSLNLVSSTISFNESVSLNTRALPARFPSSVMNLLSDRTPSVSLPTISISAVHMPATQTDLPRAIMEPKTSPSLSLPIGLSPASLPSELSQGSSPLPSSSSPPAIVLELSTETSPAELSPALPLSKLMPTSSPLELSPESAFSKLSPASSPPEVLPASSSSLELSATTPLLTATPSDLSLPASSPSELSPVSSPLESSPRSSSSLAPLSEIVSSSSSELSVASPSDLSAGASPLSLLVSSSPSELSTASLIRNSSPTSSPSELLPVLAPVSSPSALSTESSPSKMPPSSVSVASSPPELSPVTSSTTLLEISPAPSPPELSRVTLISSSLELSPVIPQPEVSLVTSSSELSPSSPPELSPVTSSTTSLEISPAPSSLKVLHVTSSSLELSPVIPQPEVSPVTSSSSELSPASPPELSPVTSSSELSPASPPELSPVTSSSELSPALSLPELSPVTSSSELSPALSLPELSPVTSSSELSPALSLPELSPVTSSSSLLELSPASPPELSPITSSSSSSSELSPASSPVASTSLELSAVTSQPELTTASSSSSSSLDLSAASSKLSRAPPPTLTSPSEISPVSSPSKLSHVTSSSEEEISPAQSPPKLSLVTSLTLSEISPLTPSPPELSPVTLSSSELSPASPQLSPVTLSASLEISPKSSPPELLSVSSASLKLSAVTTSSSSSLKLSPAPSPPELSPLTSTTSSELSPTSSPELSPVTSSSELLSLLSLSELSPVTLSSLSELSHASSPPKLSPITSSPSSSSSELSLVTSSVSDSLTVLVQSTASSPSALLPKYSFTLSPGLSPVSSSSLSSSSSSSELAPVTSPPDLSPMTSPSELSPVTSLSLLGISHSPSPPELSPLASTSSSELSPASPPGLSPITSSSSSSELTHTPSPPKLSPSTSTSLSELSPASSPLELSPVTSSSSSSSSSELLATPLHSELSPATSARSTSELSPTSSSPELLPLSPSELSPVTSLSLSELSPASSPPKLSPITLSSSLELSLITSSLSDSLTVLVHSEASPSLLSKASSSSDVSTASSPSAFLPEYSFTLSPASLPGLSPVSSSSTLSSSELSPVTSQHDLSPVRSPSEISPVTSSSSPSSSELSPLSPSEISSMLISSSSLLPSASSPASDLLPASSLLKVLPTSSQSELSPLVISQLEISSELLPASTSPSEVSSSPSSSLSSVESSPQLLPTTELTPALSALEISESELSASPSSLSESSLVQELSPSPPPPASLPDLLSPTSSALESSPATLPSETSLISSLPVSLTSQVTLLSPSELSPASSPSELSPASSPSELSPASSPSELSPASQLSELSPASSPSELAPASSPSELAPASQLSELSPGLPGSELSPSPPSESSYYEFELTKKFIPLSVSPSKTMTSVSSLPSVSSPITSPAQLSYYDFLLRKQFIFPSVSNTTLLTPVTSESPSVFVSFSLQPALISTTASERSSRKPLITSNWFSSSSKPPLQFSQTSAQIPPHLSQKVSESHFVVTEKSTLDQRMSELPSSVLTSQETRLHTNGNDSGLPPFQMISPTLPNKNVNTSVHSEPLTQDLPAISFPQLTTVTATTATATTTTTTQLTSTTHLTSTTVTTASTTTTTTAKLSRTTPAPTVSPKWPTTIQRVRTSPPRTTTTTTQSSPLNCNITDRMWVKTVLSVHIRRNRLDHILKQNLPKGLTLALAKALNDSSVRVQIESLSTLPNVTMGYYVTSGDMVYAAAVVVEALSSYGTDRLMADIRQYVPVVQAMPIPAAPWKPAPAISLMLKTVLRFVGPGDDLRSCRFTQVMEERLENAFAEAETKALNSDSTLSVEILSVSQLTGSPAVSLIYVVRNSTETLNGTVASNLLSRLTAELVGYFLFYPPLITAEPLEYHNLNTSAATKDFWVITVIQDVENSSLENQYQSFASLMEQRLAELFVVAHQQGVRFKRATTVGSYTVQMVGMRRVVGPKNPAELTYYVQLNGTPLPGPTAAKILNTVDSQTMALTLGYFVQLQAEAVVKGPSNNLWIIASVLAPIGIVTIIIIIITAVLCHKNKSEFKADGIGNLNPRVKTTYRRDMSYYHQPVQGFDYAKQHLGQLGSDEDSAPLPQAPLPIRDTSLSMDKVIHPDGTNSKKTLSSEIRKSRLPSEDGSAVSVESARPVSVRGSTVKKITTQPNLMKEESKKRTDPYDTSSGSLQLISVKPIAAPPAYSQPASSDRSQDSAVQNGEVNLALKQKSDIEHYRNKLRLKAKRKGYYDIPSAEGDAGSKATRQGSEKAERVPTTRPSSRTPEYDDDRSSTYVKSRRRHSEVKYPAYRSRQSLNSPSPGGTEMDLLVMRERPRKGIRNSGYDTEPEIIEETDVDGLAARRHYSYRRQVKGHSETSTLSSQPSIDEVRQQMHLLLEEAFSLASAGHTSSSRRHHYHQQHQAISPYSPGPAIPYSEGSASAPDTMNHAQGGLQWVPAYGHDLYQCSLSKPTFRFTQLPEMVTDSPPPPVPPRTGPAPRSSLRRSSSDLGPKAHSSESSVPDMPSQQDSNTYVPMSRGPLPPVTTEPVLNHSGNPMTAVYSIPTSRPGYPGYFISTPPSSYHSPSWMSYPPEPEDVSSPWTDSVPLPGYAEAFPNPRYPRGSPFQWNPSQAVSPPQTEPDQPFSLSTEAVDVITPITLSTSALVQAIRDEVAKLAKKQADMFEFQV